MSSSDDIYQKIILEHNRNPKFHEIPEGYTHQGESSNALCGDHVEIYFKVSDEKLSDVGFKAVGCAVCKSSASLLLMSLKGRGVKEALDFINGLDSLLDEEQEDLEVYGDLKAFSVMRKFPTRFKCVKLSWTAASSALEK